MIRLIVICVGLVLASVLAESAEAQSPTAAQSGLTLEREVEAILIAHGYEIVQISDWEEARAYREPDLKVAVRNAPYESVFGHRARIEFLLIDGPRQTLVEVKRQRVRGSVDEKLAYVYLNARHNIPNGDYLLIMDGEGWKPEARSWIEARAAETNGFDVIASDQLAVWLAGRR